MNHPAGTLSLRRFAVLAFALLIALTLTTALAASNAAAKKSKKAKVSLKIKTKNQKALLKNKKLVVKVKSTGKTKAKVKVKYKGKTNLFKKKTVKFKKNKKQTRTVKLKLTKSGKKKLSTCGAKKVQVLAKYKRGKKKKTAKKKKKLAKSKYQCDVKVPLGDNPEYCDWFDTTVCLQPFANDYYTKEADTPTGKQLNLNPDSTPVNTGSKTPVHVSVTDINRGDGFSPGNLITLKIPGLDTPQAFENSGLVSLADISQYSRDDQPLLLIDADTGERQPVWAELDSNPTSVDPSDAGPGGINANPGNTGPVNLLVRPAKNLAFGHRYIVAFRDLKDASDKAIPAPTAFEVYRDKLPTKQSVVEDRRSHMYSVINTLVDKAGVKRSSLYMAWDFTVASQQSVTERALDIRNDAYSRLGDSNLADRKIAAGSTSPQIDVTAWCDYSNTSASTPGGANCGNSFPSQSPVPNGTTTQRTVVGKLVNVPCYLNQNGCPPGAQFEFNADGTVKWNPAYTTEVPFRCIIPKSTVAGGAVHPGGTGTYGHGLLGSLNQINATEQTANDTNSSWCATNWAGFSEDDLGLILAALRDMSEFNKAVDRMVQGFVNFMMLQRALIHPNGFADEPAFNMTHDGTNPVAVPGSAIDTSAGLNTRGYYEGISQGGIMGGALTALDPDVDRGVLGVPGINYSTLLRRSVDSDDYFKNPTIGLYKYYPNEAERPVLLSLMQLLWDRGEGNGYAHNLTDNPLPGTNSHEVLMRAAVGDHQVSNYAAEVEARTIGAVRYAPTLVPARQWETNYEAIPPVTTFPAGPGESFFVYYDGGPPSFDGLQDPGSGTPPLENLPPRTEWGYGEDPHGFPRKSVDGLDHAKTFLENGTIGACAAPSGYCFSNGWDGTSGLP